MDWKAASPSRSDFGKPEVDPAEESAASSTTNTVADSRRDEAERVAHGLKSQTLAAQPDSELSDPEITPSKLSRLSIRDPDSTSAVLPALPVQSRSSTIRSDVDAKEITRTARVDSLASNSTTMSTSPIHGELPITPSSPVGPASQLPFPSQAKVVVVSPTTFSMTDSQNAPFSVERPFKSLRIGHGKDDILGEGRCARVHRAIWQPHAGPAYDKHSRGGTVCAVKVFVSPDDSTRKSAFEEGQVMRLLEPRHLDTHTARAERCLRMLAWLEEDDVLHEWPSSMSSDAASRSRSGSLGYQRGHTRYRSDSSATSTIGLSSPTTANFASAIPSLYMVMPLMECGTIDRVISSLPRIITASVWSKWARQSLEALAWCHAHGVIHADVKPANLLVDAALNIKLADFGSAVVLHDSSSPLPTDGLGKGTVSYSSPEIVDPNPDRPFGPPTDVFSLGVSLCQCLTGKAPYGSRRTVEIMYLVRKGAFWATFERDRIARALTASDSVALSDATWQDAAGVRRSGSLREPAQSQKSLSRPPIPRMSSTEELVKRNRSRPSHVLGQPDDYGRWPGLLDGKAYSDESPAMRFLDGTQRVPETYRKMLKSMVDPDQFARPTAEALLDALTVM